MKKYIFVTMNIGGINGAEQYIYNKMNYLKKLGQQVFIFSARPEKILIDGFREYENLVNPALRFYPYYLNRREYNKTINWILSVIGLQEGDSCTVESSNVTSALWGELIAQKLGCKHLAVIMQEHYNYNQAMRSFLRSKLEQHDLSGILKSSVGEMLGDPSIPVREDMWVSAYCNNVVQDCADNFSHLLDKTADYTIGSIGRLEKVYVPALMDRLAEYFAAHPDKRYNLLLIGGASDNSRIHQIHRKFSSFDNVKLVITGSLYPIPRKLIQNVDLFMSASGSGNVTYYEMVPTIRLNYTTAEPVGIIGHDMAVEKGDYVTPLADRTLLDCMDQVLTGSVEIEFIENYEAIYNKEMYEEFDRQMRFGEELRGRTYYDVRQVRYSSLLYRGYSVVCRVAGVKITYAVLEFVRKLLRGTE